MSGDRCLIVNADDFGRSPGVNRGIIRAHIDGIVTSTTLMVNTPWAEDALALARACPRLGIGLHLNLCYGRPVADRDSVPSLVRPDGCFETDLRRLVERATSDDIATETRSQLERFQRLTGRSPTHLDSHKYLHSLEPFAAPVLDAASRNGLAVRALNDADRSRTQALEIRHPDRFEGRFHGAEGDGVTVDVLAAALEELADGVTELMCHPGCVDQELMDSSYRDAREREVEALCDAAIVRLVEKRGIKLATFGVLMPFHVDHGVTPQHR
jgi:predicted glycoside hydrolase/deacetylase ChbG (UPF0249 family)